MKRVREPELAPSPPPSAPPSPPPSAPPPSPLWSLVIGQDIDAAVTYAHIYDIVTPSIWVLMYTCSYKKVH